MMFKETLVEQSLSQRRLMANEKYIIQILEWKYCENRFNGDLLGFARLFTLTDKHAPSSKFVQSQYSYLALSFGLRKQKANVEIDRTHPCIK